MNARISASRGIEASTRSTSERPPARRVCSTVAVVTRRSFRHGAEDDARVEVEVTPDEPARDFGFAAGREHGVESLARRVGDRHEHDVGLCTDENSVELRGAAENLDAVHAASAQVRVVVHEAHDTLASGLAELAHEAASGPARTDDQRAPRRAIAYRALPDQEHPLGEPGAGDRDHADQRVDDEEGEAEVAHVLRQFFLYGYGDHR